MRHKLVRIDALPPTTAGLDRALSILQDATGCPDSEAERLLGEWDALVIRYGAAVHQVGEVHQVRRDPLPIRMGDQQAHQAALL